LFEYVMPIGSLCLYTAIYFLLSRFLVSQRVSLSEEKYSKFNYYFLIVLLLNTALLLVNKEHKLIVLSLSIVWLFLFIWLPIRIFVAKPFTFILPKRAWFALLCFVTMQNMAIFIPLIINPMTVGNDYFNIPEKTILKSGRIVDNLDYINKHNIAGLQIYDPRKDLGQNPVVKAGTNLDNQIDKVLISSKIYSEEEIDFIEKNENELLNQAKAGWFFYHHGYNFGPMNALSLGASAYSQTMVYGWLNTVVQSKILDSMGMLNFQGYFKTYFAEYLIYFILFQVGIWLIFRRLNSVVFASILALSALMLLGIELIRLAPGFNPVRHAFDIPVFYWLHQYFVKESKIFLFLSCILALFSIFWSKDFGLFLAVSAGGAVFFKGIIHQPFLSWPIFVGCLTIATGILIYFYPAPGANPTAFYMLLGVGSPNASSGVIFYLLIVVTILFGSTIILNKTKADMALVAGFALYFCQTIIYYIWYPSLHHLFGAAPCFILWFVWLLNAWVNDGAEPKIAKRETLVLCLLFICVYIPASISFYWTQYKYAQTFKSHQLFNWTSEKASFLTTMEPTLFEEASNLIKLYSPNKNGIFIISKYDHILPILAGKYSEMPYNELPTNLVSRKEVELASESILKSNAPLFFADTDIGRNLKGEIPLETDPVVVELGLFSEARARAMVLQGLNDVFTLVTTKYVRCKSGRLISVYCRKTE
jgi:hypothetical protein